MQCTRTMPQLHFGDTPQTGADHDWDNYFSVWNKRLEEIRFYLSLTTHAMGAHLFQSRARKRCRRRRRWHSLFDSFLSPFFATKCSYECCNNWIESTVVTELSTPIEGTLYGLSKPNISATIDWQCKPRVNGFHPISMQIWTTETQ